MPRQQQLALPIGREVEVPEHLLREAYRRSGLRQSFDEAMELFHLKASLKHEAIALGKCGNGRKRK